MFIPPYSLNLKTNVGQLFLKLLDRHFPRAHKFHKIFNRKTVKISYRLDNKCFTPNISYEAQITNKTNNGRKKYLTAAETSFKEKYSNHMRDFNHKKYI